MEMHQSRCRAGKDGSPFGRRVHRATEVLHAINTPWGARRDPVACYDFAEAK